MMRATKYGKLLFIGFFFFGCALTWANTSNEIKRNFANSVHVIKVSDSTISKKKGKESTKTKKSKVKTYNKRSSIYLSNLRKDVSESARRERGNSVSTNSFVINNRLEPSTLSNVISFNIYDKGFNTHSFSGTQSTMHPLNFTFENTVNTKLELYGFEYRFKSAETKKFGYLARARLERDNTNKSYYQFGLGVNSKSDKVINLLGLNYFPVRSGPGHILEIYRTQLANYNEFQLTKRLKQIALFEGNYYSDVEGDFVLLSRTEYLVAESSGFRISPLIEAAYGLGSIDRRDGYPYWMADKRVYGGGGLALSIGSETSAFQVLADASVFGEVGQASFERYTGNLSYHIKNFSTVNAGFEVYTIENFYSNVFQLGMVYNFN